MFSCLAFQQYDRLKLRGLFAVVDFVLVVFALAVASSLPSLFPIPLQHVSPSLQY